MCELSALSISEPLIPSPNTVYDLHGQVPETNPTGFREYATSHASTCTACVLQRTTAAAKCRTAIVDMQWRRRLPCQ